MRFAQGYQYHQSPMMPPDPLAGLVEEPPAASVYALMAQAGGESKGYGMAVLPEHVRSSVTQKDS
jgi:hypothetical protein